MLKKALLPVLVLIYLFLPFLYVIAATSASTTMVWFVPTDRSITVAYGGSCSATAFFFVESIALDDPDVDGNGSRILPAISRTGTDSNCQSSSVAGITVTNAGNVAYDVNASFSANIDENLWLKVWQGTGAGCGTLGFGGWDLRCRFTENDAGSDLNQAGGCRDFNSSNETISATLATSLPINDTNQLCFSGDFLGSISGAKSNVAQGDHNGTFVIISEGS